MPIDRMEGKFKLSQNRPEVDQWAVMRHFEADPEPTSQALTDLMKKYVVGESA
jgi:predicted FMN-binding regulatory protein PaiB